MRSGIHFERLDDRAALDLAILIEEDAQLRYEQLAQLLGNDPGGAGEVFRAMVATERTIGPTWLRAGTRGSAAPRHASRSR